MREQYLAEVKIGGNKWYSQKEWFNASVMQGGKRYLSSKDQAIEAIEKVVKRFDGKAKVEIISNGGIGISSEIEEGTKVTEYRIKKRLVSDWSEI